MAFIILNQKLIKLEIAGKNPIAAGNFSWIFARDCEGTEQLPIWKLLRLMRQLDGCVEATI